MSLRIHRLTPASPGPLLRAARAMALALLAVFVAGSFLAPAAQASDKSRVLALHVDAPRLAAKDRAALDARLKERLSAYPGLELLKPPDGDITDQMIDLECIDLDADCLGRLAARNNAQRVLHAEVTRKGKAESLRVRVIEADGNKVVLDQTGEARDGAGLLPVLERAIEAAFGPVPSAPAAPTVGTLVIEVDSQSAAIYLGQDYVGTGRARVELAPGEYTVRVTHIGSEEVIRKVVVTAGETTTERVALAPVVAKPPVQPPPDEADSGAGWVLWVVIGAAVVGGTIAAIALTQDGGDNVVRGPAVLSIDPTGAWRDPTTLGGRR